MNVQTTTGLRGVLVAYVETRGHQDGSREGKAVIRQTNQWPDPRRYAVTTLATAPDGHQEAYWSTYDLTELEALAMWNRLVTEHLQAVTR